uniref:Peptidase M14 domain-containing protein n=1 Tax=Tetranychus urticae TaxID=32264 RepID=T1K979_TETUR
MNRRKCLIVDVWNRPSDANFTVWAAVDEDDEDFLKALDKIPIPFDILFENKAAYLALVNYTQPKLDLASDASSIKPVRPSLFKRYYRYTEYLSIIKSWADEFQSMYLISIGKSFEGRVIPAVVINRESQMDIASVDGDQDGDGDYDDDDVDGTDDSKISHQDGITGSHDRNRNRNNRQPNRRPPNNECKTVVIECGLHAREWASPASCLYLIHFLATTNSPIFKRYQFHIIPIANPDGYAYTWSRVRGARLWRKNRSKRAGVSCIGVDLNRNFNIDWCKIGSSRNPCKENYCGPKPNSEPETRSLVNYYKKLDSEPGECTLLYFTIHSYGQWILWPYGFTKNPPKNLELLETVGQEAINRVNRNIGRRLYRGGQTAQAYKYASSGGSDDWVYSRGFADIAITFETRDNGQYGFLLPPELIVPAAQDAKIAIEAILEKRETMFDGKG